MADNVETLSQDVRVLVNGKPATLSLTTKGEVVGSHPSQARFLPAVPAYDIIWAELTETRDIELSYLKRAGKGQSALVKACWKVDEADRAAADKWCNSVMEAAYDGITPKRRLRVLVNPHGGPGKAPQVYRKIVEPIFLAAHCVFETTFTERSKHASDIARELPLEPGYDALVLLSGDGLLHEIYNGFAEHNNPIKAFSLPIAHIPTGSANGTALNLLGLEYGLDVGVASLNAIKGKPMKQDICSVTIGEQRIFTYMTQALGLMADLDLGTEHLRWMGDARFIYGFFRGVLKLKPCPLTLEIKVAEDDKDKMFEEFRTRAEASRREHHQRELEDYQQEVGKDALPVLRHTEKPSEDNGWITFDKPIIYLYAGKSPYVSRDFMQFPVAHASDGLIDIAVQEITSRGKLLSSLDGAEKGTSFWNDTQYYFKAHAYRVTPHDTRGNFAVDGETYPLQPFTVECHRALGALLSPTGYYAADFNVPRPATRKQVKGSTAEDEQQEDGEGDKEEKSGWREWVPCC